MNPEVPSVDQILEETDQKPKDIRESFNILQSIVRRYFIQRGFEYSTEEGRDAYIVPDRFLRFHDFSMVELARYHNLICLMKTMESMEIVSSQFRSWLETTNFGNFQWLIDVYEMECTNIYTSCLGLQPENLLSTINNENEINDIRRYLLHVIEAFEKLQQTRTKQVTLQQQDDSVESGSADLRDLDVNWKELVNAREQLPYFEMLDGLFVKVNE